MRSKSQLNRMFCILFFKSSFLKLIWIAFIEEVFRINVTCKIVKNLVPIIQSDYFRTVKRSFYYLSLQGLIEVKLLTAPP